MLTTPEPGWSVPCDVCGADVGVRCTSGTSHAVRLACEGEKRGRELGIDAIIALFPEKSRDVLSKPGVSFTKSGSDGWWHARLPGKVKGIGIPFDVAENLMRYGLVVRKRGTALNVTDWGREIFEAMGSGKG